MPEQERSPIYLKLLEEFARNPEKIKQMITKKDQIRHWQKEVITYQKEKEREKSSSEE